MLPKNPFVQNRILGQIQGGLKGVQNAIQQNVGKLSSNLSNAIPDIGGKPQTQPQPQTQSQPQQYGILQPAPNATGAQLQRNLQADRLARQQARQQSGRSQTGNPAGVFTAPQDISAEEQAMKDELARREQANEAFRGQLGTRFNELRGQFGGILGEFQNKLRDIPNSIRELSNQYKSALGEQETQRLGQLGTQREKVAEQQRQGLKDIAKDVRAQTKAGISRLSQMGAGNSSAAKMFQFAIQQASNKNIADLLKQAADNYNNLDQEEKKLKSQYNTIRDNIALQEQDNIRKIDEGVNETIQNINKNLEQSGELERLSKEELSDRYLTELSKSYQGAVSQSKVLKDQLNQWRLENATTINDLKNQLVQDFIPKELSVNKLTGINQEEIGSTISEPNYNLNLRRLKTIEDRGTPQNILNPRTLQERVRQGQVGVSAQGNTGGLKALIERQRDLS